MKNVESAGGVVVNKEGLVLLVKNIKTGSWSFPKGHVDPGEDFLETAKREVHEESGISRLRFIEELGAYKRKGSAIYKPEMKTIHLFLFRTAQSKLKPIDPENPEAKWVPKDKVAGSLTYKEDKKFFLSVISRI